MGLALIKNPKNRYKKKIIGGRKSLIFYSLLLVIPVIQFIVFYIMVNFNSFFMAFQTYENGAFHFNDITNPSDFWKNFIRIFTFEQTDNKNLWIYFKNSFIVWGVGIFAGTLLAIFFSFYIYRKRKLSYIFKFFLFLPSIIPSVLLTTIFSGFLDNFLSIVLRERWGWDIPVKLIQENSPYSLFIVILFGTWISFGTQVLLYSNAMSQINGAIMEASELDGCSPIRQLFTVVIPQILPTISTFLIASIAGFFTNQALLYNFFPTGTDKFGTIGYFIYVYSAPGGLNAFDAYPFVSALGLLCTSVAIPLIFTIRKILSRWEK